MEQIERPNVLFVDDDVLVLSSYKRALKRKYNMELASNGEEALEKLASASFAVVVSDLHMPGMNGITLLEIIKEREPDTMTIMLTGNSDIRLAMAAVNQGHVFRFYTKPCEPETLAAGIDAAATQYDLIRSERVLLDETLRGALQTLSQVLSLTSPESFSRASRMERLVREMVKRLALRERWEFEVAASLSQLGCLTLPPRILRLLAAGENLAQAERNLYEEHPKHATQLLRHIPRLESVRAMIERQMVPYQREQGFTLEPPLSRQDRIRCGGQMLKLAHDYDIALSAGKSSKKALDHLNHQAHLYHPTLLEELTDILVRENRTIIKVEIHYLKPGMLLEEDIYDRNERLIVKSGQEITPVIQRYLEKVEFVGGLQNREVMASVETRDEQVA